MGERFRTSPEQPKLAVTIDEKTRVPGEYGAQESATLERQRVLTQALHEHMLGGTTEGGFIDQIKRYQASVERAGLSVLSAAEPLPADLEQEIEYAWSTCVTHPDFLLEPEAEELFNFLRKHFAPRPFSLDNVTSAFDQAAEKILSDLAKNKITSERFKECFSRMSNRYGQWSQIDDSKVRAHFVSGLLKSQAVRNPDFLQQIKESVGDFSFTRESIEEWSNNEVQYFVQSRQYYDVSMSTNTFAQNFKKKCQEAADRFGIEAIFTPAVFRTDERKIVEEPLNFIRLEACTGLKADLNREEAEQLLVSGLAFESRQEHGSRELSTDELVQIKKYLGNDTRLSPENYENFWTELLAGNQHSLDFITRRAREMVEEYGELPETIVQRIQKRLNKEVSGLCRRIKEDFWLDGRSVYLFNWFKDLAKLSLASGVHFSNEDRDQLYTSFFSRGSSSEQAREYAQLAVSLLRFEPSSGLRLRAAEERLAIILQTSDEISPEEESLFFAMTGEKELNSSVRQRVGERAVDKIFLEDFAKHNRPGQETNMNDVVVNSIHEAVKKINAFSGVKAKVPAEVVAWYAKFFFKENLRWDKRSSPVQLLDKTCEALENISVSPSAEYLARCAGQAVEKLYSSEEVISNEGKQQMSDFFDRLETLVSREQAPIAVWTNTIRDQLITSPLTIIRWNEFLRQEAGKSVFLSEFSEAWFNDPWVNMFESLAHIQRPSAAAEHDPWRTELSNLMKRLQGIEADSYEEDLPPVIDVRNPEDSKIVRRFILDMGMINSPQWFAVYAACLRTERLEDLPSKMIDDLAELGLPLYKKTTKGNIPRFQNTASILPEIAKLKFRFQSDLLAGRLPPGARHKLGSEMFSALRGTSAFGNGSDSNYLISEWEQTSRHHPELIELPVGYVEFSIELPEAARHSPELEASVLKALQEPRWEALRRHADIIRGNSDEWWINFKMRFDEYAYRLEQTTDTSGNNREAVRLTRAIFESIDDDYVSPQDKFKVLAALSKTDPSPEIDDLLQELSLVSAFNQFSRGGERAMYLTQFGGMGYEQRGRLANIKQYYALARFEEEYIREHYLHQNQNHAGHQPFSQETLDRLSTLWSDPARRISSAARYADQRFREQAHQTSKKSSKKQTIALVPTRGPLRPLAGAIADACFVNADISLARGEFPNLTPWMYVVGRSSARERIVGSVLTVDTHRSDGVPVLLVRGNNPRENLARSVKADSLVVESLRGMADVARTQWQERCKTATTPADRRQCLMIPRDVTKGSSTNRFSIGDVYERRFTSWVPHERAPYISGLIEEPETEFNNHKNWDKEGLAASVVIWEIDEQGRETWYGDWS